MGNHGGVVGRLHVDVERHGLDWASFGLLLKEQGFLCGACSRSFPVGSSFYVDHDERGYVRGVLCHSCISAQWLPFEYLDDPPAVRVFDRLPRYRDVKTKARVRRRPQAQRP